MIISHTFVVGGNGYKNGVSKQGKPWQLQSFKAFPFEEYVSVMLPEYVHEGMTVTISGKVKREENGDYVNYSFVYPTIDTVYRPETQQNNQSAPQQGNRSFSTTDLDPFSGGNPIDISDDALPF